MSRLRASLVAGVVALAALALTAAPAFATVQATCSSLGQTLSTATNNEVIELTGLCTGANATFALPSSVDNLTIEGASTGVNGFDGTGVATGALSGSATDGVTLSGLTFENYTQSPAVGISGSSTGTSPFVFSGDTFTGDTGGSGTSGGGLSLRIIQPSCAFSDTAVTLSGSTFSHDSVTGVLDHINQYLGGGGGAFIDLECQTGAQQAVSITGNTFSDDSAQATNGNGADGGGLFLSGADLAQTGTTIAIAVTQSGNRFTGDSVSSTSGTAPLVSGGGEFVTGAYVTSDGDSFIGNSAAGPNVAGGVSWGAGLSTLGGGDCVTSTVSSTFTNLVATGNTIGAPSGGATSSGAGAGIYAGCSPTADSSYHLTLINSTISGNSASGTGAVAGVDGESGDTLTLENSILYGDSGGSEIGGFGGGINVSTSDTCTGTSPHTGAGNICADPKLLSVATGDVHETASSPTIDAGANADVPGGVSTDYYGQQRIQYGSNTGPFSVDIGAAEFHFATPTITDCSRLQNTLDAAESGDDITLATLCTATNSGSADGSFTLPAASGVTIQGASAGTNGFDGGDGAATAPALTGPASGLTLRNLTFEHYQLTSNGAVVLQPTAGALPVIDGDQFIDNSATTSGFDFGAALEVFDDEPSSTCPYTSPLTITNSTFSGNESSTTSTSTGGLMTGAASIDMFCGIGATATVNLTGNMFTANSIHTAGPSAYGGGLFVSDSDNGQLVGVQSHNVFSDNSILSTGTSAAADYDGAGEWLANVNLTSTADEFIGNSLPGPAGAAAASEGAGLGVVRGACSAGGGPATFSATATNLVAIDNTIGTPSAGGSVEGAGVYAGCLNQQGTGGFHLTLINSTVSGNAGPGGAAGVDGEATDVLKLENSIVFSDTGAGSKEIGGFGATDGANVTADHSDVCAEGSSTAPFAGTGNLCADPKLAGVATGDVHETASSPTIDAGANADVPGGVTTDFYGQPRIVGTKQSAGIVDIGAAEWQVAFKAPTPPSKLGKAKVSGEKATASGVQLTITCTGSSGQSCAGGVTVTTTETLKGSKVVALANATVRRRKSVASVASASYHVAAGKHLALTLKLNGKGRALLKKFGKLPVTVVATQRNASGKPVTISKRKLTIKPAKPKRRKRK